jgi:nucleoside-triphosphatase THEP1
MPATRLIVVGGFLGAGKTTLLLRAAGMLREQGYGHLEERPYRISGLLCIVESTRII